MSYEDNFLVWGPYNSHHGRKIVIVVDHNGIKRTLTYPRWLMEIYLGYPIDPNLTVDHIDSDINNNNISNFRALDSSNGKSVANIISEGVQDPRYLQISA